MKNQKAKIIIFYGPRKEFVNMYNSEKSKENFPKIVQEYDNFNKSVLHHTGEISKEHIEHHPRKINNLIISSDDYFSITESAVQNINPILDFFELENVYIQNPPISVVDNLKKNYKNITEKYYNYKKLSLETIKLINRNYSNKIIGQDKAIHKLLSSLLSFIKFKHYKKTIVIMFYGSSGVGKTETAKYLSQKLGGKLFYKQFSMFQNNEFSNYLFGGLNSQNSFAKELLERMSNVILLDEFDKAHSHFYSAFYQLFDEGVYIDKNYKVKLQNSIIICTSNFKSTEEIREKLGDPIYYRIDSFIHFEDLDSKSINKIIDIKYDHYISNLSDIDKNVIENTMFNGRNVRDSLKQFAERLKNVREIDNIVKELLLDILLEHELNESDEK